MFYVYAGNVTPNIQTNISGTANCKTCIPKGGEQLPSPAGLHNQGLVQKGQPEARGVPKHTMTVSPRLVLDAPSALYYSKGTQINTSNDKNTVKTYKKFIKVTVCKKLQIKAEALEIRNLQAVCLVLLVWVDHLQGH